MIRDYQAISKTWFPKGQQKIIPTYRKHHGAKLVGFLNYETVRYMPKSMTSMTQKFF